MVRVDGLKLTDKIKAFAYGSLAGIFISIISKPEKTPLVTNYLEGIVLSSTIYPITNKVLDGLAWKDCYKNSINFFLGYIAGINVGAIIYK